MHTGGAERVVAILVNAFAALGREVTLIVTYSGGGECHYLLDNRVKLIYIKELVAKNKSWGIPYLKRLLALRDILKASPSATVVCFLTNVNVAALLASLMLKIRVVVSERTYPPCCPLSVFWECLRLLTYPLADRVVMQTEKGLAWLAENIPLSRGVVIPNPVVYPLIRAEPLLSVVEHVHVNRKLLLAVGRLDEGKQFDRLIEAFSWLAKRHADWDLVILGEGAERKNLEGVIKRLDLNSRVRMPGRCGNVGDWYERADLYVMSSRFEGFPNTLAEAMAHGCAAVSYDCDTGPRDIIRHGVDGLLVRPVGDVAALADALELLMEDEPLRKNMGCRASEVRERFSLEKILGLWESILAMKK